MFGAVLRFVPWWAWAGLALAGLAAWNGHKATAARAELAQQQRQVAEERLQTSELRAEAIHGALVETVVRLNRQQKAADDAHLSSLRDAAAAAGADRTGGLFRDYARGLAAGAASCNSTAAAVSPAASSPGLVLADMLGRVEEAGRRLAAEADRRRTAGVECEQRYDALKGSP